MPNFPIYKKAATEPAFSVAVAIASFEPLYPYPQNRTAILYRTRYMQQRAYYIRPDYNAPHPDMPQAYFVDDVDFQDRLNGMIEWTRVYATIPASWNDFQSYAYTFPGYAGIRVPYTRTVTARLTKDYFLVGNTVPFLTNVTSGDSLAFGTTYQSVLLVNYANIPESAGLTMNASLFAPNAATNSQHWINLSSTAAAGNQYGSVFAKIRDNGVINCFRMTLTAGATQLATADFDLNNGATNFSNGVDSYITAIGDGWWRCTVQANSANANPSLTIYALNATNSDSFAATGAEGFYLWRAQVATNATKPHTTVPPTLTPDLTNYPIQSADLIPVKFGLQYVFNWPGNLAAEFLSGSTSPTLTGYKDNVNIDQAAANANIYSIEATDSVLELYNGTLWQRTRTFVKAR